MDLDEFFRVRGADRSGSRSRGKCSHNRDDLRDSKDPGDPHPRSRCALPRSGQHTTPNEAVGRRIQIVTSAVRAPGARDRVLMHYAFGDGREQAAALSSDRQNLSEGSRAMTEPRTLAVDIGGSGIKAVLLDED